MGTNLRNIGLINQKNLEELMDLGIDSLDAHTTHHIKGDVIWALGPKAKHEIMRNVTTKSQCGKELKTSAYKKC